MPELPEVETIVRLLRPSIVGKTIADVRIFRPKSLLADPEGFAQAVKGKTIIGLERKGKFLLFRLTGGLLIVSHLRMEGKYYEAKAGIPPAKHDILIYDFTDGTALRFVDVRKFGIVLLRNEKDYLSLPPLSELGKEPWELTPREFHERLGKKRKEPIKEAILDQRLIAGLGNIYADEALFAARINPLKPASSLTEEECARLLKEARRILEEAIASGGSTIRSYHPREGMSGRMQNKLLAYGHANEPCPRCGFPLRKIAVGGRGTVYCPRCQPLEGKPLIVGITGPIASGKSSVAAYLADKGYETISADGIVADLYGKEEVQRKLTELFGKEAVRDGKVDRAYLLRLSADPEKKKRLERLVHPLVFAAIREKIASSKASKIALDVPILLGTPLEGLCDLIIAVLAPEEVERARLRERGKDPEAALALNKGWPRGQAKKKAAVILDGSQDLRHLRRQLDALKYL
jgi:formamidopyrimidine-DNA glycosylase